MQPSWSGFEPASSAFLRRPGRPAAPWLWPGLLLALGWLLGLNRPAAAQQTFYWESFDVTISVQENGDLLFREDQTLVFGGEDFSFGFATINTEKTDGVDILGVREGDTVFTQSSSGAPYTYELESAPGEVGIYWNFPPTQGQHTYTFEYLVRGGFWVAEDGDELTWQVVGVDFPGEILRSRVTVELPAGVEAGSALALINDQLSEAVTITFSPDGRVITFDAPLLTPGETFEIGVRLPHGQLALQPPAWQASEEAQESTDVASLVFLALSLLVGVGGVSLVLAAWATRGRDPDVGLVADYLSEPPADLPPGVAGALVDEEVQDRDIMSALVDLARRGYMTMQEGPGSDNYTFTRTDQPAADLRPFEKTLLNGIFAAGTTTQLSALRYKFAPQLEKAREQVYQELVDRQLFSEAPSKVRERYRNLATGVFMLAGLGFCALTVTAGNVPTALCLPVALVPAIALLYILGPHMPRKTAQGAEEAGKWRAFRTYLSNIDKHRNLQQEESKEIFERYLPFAIAFGLERSWLWKFSQVKDLPPPTWYGSPGFPRRVGLPGQGGSGVDQPQLAGSPAAGGYGSGAGTGSQTSQPAGPGGLEGLSRGLTGGLEGMSSNLTRMLSSTSRALGSRTPPSATRTTSFGGSGSRSSSSRSSSSRSFSGGFRGGGSRGGGSRGGGRRGFG